MVHHYILAEIGKKKDSHLNELVEKIRSYSGEAIKVKECVAKLEEAFEIQLKELEFLKDKSENLKIIKINEIEVMCEDLKSEKLKLSYTMYVLIKLNAEKEEIERYINNMEEISIISVDEEQRKLLSNGLVDLNRDVLMRLIKIMQDKDKTRTIIGMTQTFYVWSKKRIFSWARTNAPALSPAPTPTPERPPSPPHISFRRVTRDMGQLRGLDHIDVEYRFDNPLKVILKGPHGTPYEGGKFHLVLDFEGYPLTRPFFSFAHPVYNPAVATERGRRGGYDIYSPELEVRNWAPSRTFGYIIDIVYELLKNPPNEISYPRTPNLVAAVELTYLPSEFFKKAKTYTERYAR